VRAAGGSETGVDVTDRAFYQEMGRRVKAICRSRRMTQPQLGARVGLSANQIHRIETVGRAHLTEERLAQIATALGVEVWQIEDSDWMEQCGVEA
jgi:transcriptional regulator with XRE-family HTH domain